MPDKPKQNKASKIPATQAHLSIAEIKDGVVILKDGTLRAVLMVSSINFALKSDDEQNALVGGYVSFLNSLDFPLQIVAQSRRLQIKPYLAKLEQIEKAQANELLRIQIADYRAFVKELVDMGQIMTKKFFAVVPYDPISNRKKSFGSRLNEAIRPAFSVKLKEEKFQQRKEELSMRTRHVKSGLESMGLQVVELDTQALVEIYYSTYNPDIAFSEQLESIEKLRTEE